MKSILKYSFWFGSAVAILSSCDPKVEAPTPTLDGQIDVSNYVAIGNSITAGYASNGLYLEGQKVAYPVLMAQQFKLAGGGDFIAPLFSHDQAGGTGYLRLLGFSGATPLIVPVPGSPNAVLRTGDSSATDASLNPTGLVLKPFEGTKINNWGVPGIRIADIETPRYAFKNSYFGRLVPETEKLKPYATKILEQNPTFFSCWLGNNDVLGFATAGGSELLANVTDNGLFARNYRNLLTRLLDKPAPPKGVVANIPDVTSLPFFTTVGPSLKAAIPAGVPGFYEFKFDSVMSKVNSAFESIIQGKTPSVTLIDPNKGSAWPVSRISTLNPITKSFDGDIYFTLTFAPFAPLVGQPRGAAWREIIRTLLKRYELSESAEPLVWSFSGLDTLQPFGFSIRNPIPDAFVLNPLETAKAKETVAGYNRIIEGLAKEKGLAFVNANSFLSGITKGSYFDAISSNASFISGGAFSLDGVHLTPKGNAMAANEFIKAINEKYGTKITVLNVGQYPGVTFP